MKLPWCILLVFYRFRIPLLLILLALLSASIAVPFHKASPEAVLPAPVLAAAEVTAPVAQVAANEAKSARLLDFAFSRFDYQLDSVAKGREVPPLVLAKVPKDLDSAEPDTRKDVFLRLMLPLVLMADEAVATDRRRLEDIANRERQNQALSAADSKWLNQLADKYDVEPGARLVERLLSHVDVVPPSLAMAQAALESGWGTSRLAKRGNNLFGQNLEDDGVIIGQARFPTLLDAVHSYVHNLNTHRAYANFRRVRALARAHGHLPNGAILAPTLTAYSELGRGYTTDVRSLIRDNDLARLDGARLSGRSSVRNVGI